MTKTIRVLGIPSSLGTHRHGAEGGFRAMRGARLVDQLREVGHTVEDCGVLSIGNYTDPGEPKARFLREICEICERLAIWGEETLSAGATPVFVGGDHSFSAGTVSAAASFHHHRGERIGLLWIDAHGDMNTHETSPTGNVHGMPLAALLGMGDPRYTGLRGFQPKVLPKNTVLVGIRDIDPAEGRLIEKSGVAYYTTRDIDERGMKAVMEDAIAQATDGTVGFHVSLDMDALDPFVAPGVGTPVLGGLTYREAHLALEIVADSDSMLSFDVMEINPLLDHQNQTAEVAAKLTCSAFEKRILPGLKRRIPSLRNGG